MYLIKVSQSQPEALLHNLVFPLENVPAIRLFFFRKKASKT
jgi:hypothetical protein